MRRIPPLAAVRVFEAAARHQNFTAAAAELGMTQAAVSYQVKALEDRIGTALFRRERGRAVLTPAARALAPALTEAFDGIATAFEKLRQDDETTLTVTTTQTFANTWLAWRLGSFQMEQPDLAVRLITDNRLSDLHGGEADVAVRAGRAPWPGLDCRRLLLSDFTPMASPQLIAAEEGRLGRSLVPEDLLSLPLIGADDEWWTIWFGKLGLSYDHERPRAGIRLDSQATIGRAAMVGQGFALLTPFLWRTDLTEGRLVQPFGQMADDGFAYWLCAPPERARLPKIKRFAEWLTRVIAS